MIYRPDDVLHLGSIVLRQEAVTRAEIIHLEGELVITRTLQITIITTIIIIITIVIMLPLTRAASDWTR